MKPKLLLFDLGGVLIDVDASTLRRFCPPATADALLWETWLTCPAVHAYESGKISEQDFAIGVLETFHSPMTPAAFLESFAAWPRGFFPGIPEVLRELRRSFALAYLSNSNPIHYARFQKEWQLDGYFDYTFASHLMGVAKPDPASFSRVLAETRLNAKEIWFFDDNRLNVEAAQSAGIEGSVIRGPEPLRDALRNLLPSLAL